MGAVKLSFSSIASRLILVPLVGLVGYILLGALALYALDATLTQDKEAQLKAVVEVAHGMVNAFYKRELNGEMSHEVAQAQAMLALKNLRYEKLEYLWIHDTTGPTPRMVMHPTVPALDAQVLNDPKFDKATSLHDANGG